VFKLKFGLKFLVSALQSVGVFALLFAGGIMVLNGRTQIGIVMAFISGLDRVLDPWRELIAFLRSTSAARVQFDLIEVTWEEPVKSPIGGLSMHQTIHCGLSDDCRVGFGAERRLKPDSHARSPSTESR
jgi:ABC-type bacteriocin/lantibiotic exporter with double-glycine peptidase domain